MGNGMSGHHKMLNMLDEVGADAVMIGQAALGNPWILSQVKPTYEQVNWLLATPWEKLQRPSYNYTV